MRFDLVPGAPHGFEKWARDTEPAQALLARARGWLAEVFGAEDDRTARVDDCAEAATVREDDIGGCSPWRDGLCQYFH